MRTTAAKSVYVFCGIVLLMSCLLPIPAAGADVSYTWVKQTLGEGDDPAHDFSCLVETTNDTGIIVERPMYFNYKGKWTGGHDVVGY